jgi:hypothetical protein
MLVTRMHVLLGRDVHVDDGDVFLRFVAFVALAVFNLVARVPPTHHAPEHRVLLS